MNSRIMSSLRRMLFYTGAAAGDVSASHARAAAAENSWCRRGAAILARDARWQHLTSQARAGSRNRRSGSSGSRMSDMGAKGDVAPDIWRRKRETRRKLGEVLKSLSEEEIVRESLIVTNKVIAHPCYQRAKSVSVYLSFAQEVRTDELVKDIITSGRVCYIPRFEPGKRGMEMLQLASLEDLASLPVNEWGIRQPAVCDKRRSVFDAGELDVVLLPGLAFTASGQRLGRGGGYYDTFLERCFRELRERPATIALAFREQILPEGELPVGAHDALLDTVLFPDA